MRWLEVIDGLRRVDYAVLVFRLSLLLSIIYSYEISRFVLLQRRDSGR